MLGWSSSDRRAELADDERERARLITFVLVGGLARRPDVPILVIYGDQTPPKSRAEMEALAKLPHVQVKRMEKGKLAVHEEFPDAVANAIIPFLSE